VSRSGGEESIDDDRRCPGGWFALHGSHHAWKRLLVFGLATVTLAAGVFIGLRYMGFRPNEAKTEVLRIVQGITGATIDRDPICEDGSPRVESEGISAWFVGAFVAGRANADIGQSVVTAAERYGYTLSTDDYLIDSLKRHADPTTLEYIDSPGTFDPTTLYLTGTTKGGHRLSVRVYTREAVGSPCVEKASPPAGMAILVVGLGYLAPTSDVVP